MTVAGRVSTTDLRKIREERRGEGRNEWCRVWGLIRGGPSLLNWVRISVKRGVTPCGGYMRQFVRGSYQKGPATRGVGLEAGLILEEGERNWVRGSLRSW